MLLRQLLVCVESDRTILKCTGGPPKEVNPKYQFSLIVSQNLGPRFQSMSGAHLLGDQRSFTPIFASLCRAGLYP